MSSRRAPWWMYVIAASFVIYFALLLDQDLRGPAWMGIAAYRDRRLGGMVLTNVFPGTPAERAGLQAGDRLLAVDGQFIRSRWDWWALFINREIGRPQRLEIERRGERIQAVLTFPRVSLSFFESSFGRGQMAVYIGLLVSLILALIVGLGRPYDLVARVGALFLAGLAVTGFAWSAGLAVAWRHLPWPLGILLLIPVLSDLARGQLLFTFFAVFPGKLFGARWAWALVWAPLLLCAPWIYYAYRAVYHPERAAGIPGWIPGTWPVASPIYDVPYAVAGLAALVMNYRRLRDINQRRRIRVLVGGVLVGISAAATGGALGLNPDSKLARASFWRDVQQALMWLFLAFPLSFAYAVLRHRLFDVRVMIRQGLRYALARRVLVSFAPALGVILVADLLLHRRETVGAVLQLRGWVYVAAAGVGLLAQSQRQQWLTALDRRFFRERYNAQRLLREVVEMLREAGSLERMAPHVVAQIERALHPEFTALLVREPGAVSFRSLAASPAGVALPDLPADSKLISIVQVLAKPLEFSQTETGWVKQQLLPEETDYLRRARIDLLVPVASVPQSLGPATPEGRTAPPLPEKEALLALGVKRSEEPYSREDQDLLMTIAAGLALLLEKPVTAASGAELAGKAWVAPSHGAPSDGIFEECDCCGLAYDRGTMRCVKDGSLLISIDMPRLLVGRYRLEHRLGRGGMGAVYSATDTALKRRVAAKVMRADLVRSEDAAERFRHEATAAASFAHPNVVTVYDFGVAAGDRGFMVMELLDGATLREELRGGRLERARTLKILHGVGAALNAAHRRQLVHRDLKPENIFLARGEAGEVAKVLDFGIAKVVRKAEGAAGSKQDTVDRGSGAVMGTLRYMAPEQLRGEPAAAAWDQWALAVIAYEMLTGAHPFPGAPGEEVGFAVLSGRFTPVTRHLPGAPASWQRLFARAFALRGPERPDSIGAFLQELEQALV